MKKYKLRHILPLIFVIMANSSCKAKGTLQTTVSPNDEIKVFVCIDSSANTPYGRAFLTIQHATDDNQEKVIIEKVELGIQTNYQNLTDSLQLISVSDPLVIRDNYAMLTGKRSHCINYGTERIYTLENKDRQVFRLVVRAYNDGVAFKYEFDAMTEGERILSENTSYHIPDGTNRWIQPYDPGYEDFYPLSNNGKYEFEHKWNRIPDTWGYPALIESQNGLFALITEANIMYGHCASRLKNPTNREEYQIDLADKELPISNTYVSPWRVVIAGALADVVESTLVTDISEPAKINNTDWIKPGLSAWIYWAYNNSSNDYQKVKEYIDLAAEMKWPYNLIDWKWDEMANGGTIEDALKYSIDKAIRPMLWYNSSTGWVGENAPEPLYRLNEKEKRLKEYQWLRNHGVAGIKVDFFNGDGVSEMNYYIDLLEDASNYELLINFHGATLPRGWQRTYPHLMTVEGVYGAEWYNNLPILTNKAACHNTTLPFTRNVVGSMDYTPGTFSDSQHPHITSYGHELALYVVFESALQHMPDRPSTYLSLPKPIKNFLSSLPTTWDDTKLLDGYPGKFIILARKKGDTWYIGGLNGTDECRTLFFKPNQIFRNAKEITIFKDGDDNRKFDIQENRKIINNDEMIEISCLPRGGFSAVLK